MKFIVKLNEFLPIHLEQTQIQLNYWTYLAMRIQERSEIQINLPQQLKSSLENDKTFNY